MPGRRKNASAPKLGFDSQYHQRGLTLGVNTTNGQTRLINTSGQAIDLAYYEILSASDSLNPTGWTSLNDQTTSGGAWGRITR
jgi:hypothetical protein